MDRRNAAINLINSYHQFLKDKNISKLIKDTCNYYDYLKDKTITQGELEILYKAAHIVGIPHYFDILNNKFQSDDIEFDNMSLDILSASISNIDLQIDSNVLLHRYQKEVYDKFIPSNKNRFFLSAPTSFGKTYIVFQLIKKMEYNNVVLIFPTISLLTENYLMLLNLVSEDSFFKNYDIHTLSDSVATNSKNIFIYTPERFLSYLDKNFNANFDFIFIDEIYKIDNEYMEDEEIKENERDINYRIALNYTCKISNDFLLAGPYINLPDINNRNQSFLKFMDKNTVKPLIYNDIEIVNKNFNTIKQKKEYTINNNLVEIGNAGIPQKIANIASTLSSDSENTIIYYNTPAYAEKCANEIIPKLNFSKTTNDLLDIFIKHIEKEFGDDWILVKALKKRIGIHHGLIPKYIQKQIIEFFNNGSLLVLISTTTITEGVNTSAKHIIVASNKKGDKLLKSFDAKNIAGRAGRFGYHFIGQIIILAKNFEELCKKSDEILNHKNYDINTSKTEIDLLITDYEYLSEKYIKQKDLLLKEANVLNIPEKIISQFKSVNISDKLTIYKELNKQNTTDLELLQEAVYNHENGIGIKFSQFQKIIDIIYPIINNKHLSKLIINKYKRSEQEKYSIICPMLQNYLASGFTGLVGYKMKEGKFKKVNNQYFEINDKNFTGQRYKKRETTKDGKISEDYRIITKDGVIRETSTLVYNTFRYQLVKYLGIFDLVYRYVIAKRTNKNMEDVIAFSRLIRKLEYNVLSTKARVLSDYGVPFAVMEYYEKNDSKIQKTFDPYEQHIDNIIQKLFE